MTYRHSTVQDAVQYEIITALQPYASSYDLEAIAADTVTRTEDGYYTVTVGTEFWDSVAANVKTTEAEQADSNEETLF